MRELDTIRHIYFIGIGGIGMSALARYFHARGVTVSGYDRTATPLTRALEDAGMQVSYTDSPETIPGGVDTVVYTPAIPADNLIRKHFEQSGLMLMKRSDILQVVSAGSFNICIAGTHGKTTISTMTAHVLRHSGFGCNAFLGGISANYGTNFWSDPRNVCVIEADEYDRSFLKLSPDIASVSAMDADHLDIYGTAGEMEQAFIEFTGKIKPGGLLLYRAGLPRAAELQGARRWSYDAHGAAADIRATNVVLKDGAYQYDVEGPGWTIRELLLQMGGRHNVENSLVAIGVAKALGISDERIRAAVADFKGVKRRFQYIIKTAGLVFVDDYAHHPEELRALIGGARELFPGMRCTVVFQPHLFTRTRDFADGFAESLDMADEVLLMPIYPARELPIPGVDSAMIAARMQKKPCLLQRREAVLDALKDYRGGLLITAGAGDIDAMVEPIEQRLTNK
jgi:UDP-N-acetylmuramate--alanine ligase